MAVFDKIVFNFPHTACGIKDTLENNRVHQRLLTSFFNAAAPLQRPARATTNGAGKVKLLLPQIHVTLKTGEPYSSWQISRLARLTGTMRLQTAIDFYPALYSGYEHRRTVGGFRSRDATKAVEANKDITKASQEIVGARTYLFIPTANVAEDMIRAEKMRREEEENQAQEEESEEDNEGGDSSYPGAGNW
tara:strand:+ start:112 stop:684 length:573 start_codon:yes stop_codon:yes gene_type:complete